MIKNIIIGGITIAIVVLIFKYLAAIAILALCLFLYIAFMAIF